MSKLYFFYHNDDPRAVVPRTDGPVTEAAEGSGLAGLSSERSGSTLRSGSEADAPTGAAALRSALEKAFMPPDPLHDYLRKDV